MDLEVAEPAMKGSDLHSEVTVSFEEAAFGCDRMMRLSDPSGKGSVQTLKVHVPAGIENGKSIRLKGKGNPGFNGGPAGDLFLQIHVEEKQGFERKGMDVYTTTEIPFTTAIFGGEAKVSTLYGDVVVKIPGGNQGRKEDPSERQRYCFHAEFVCTWRSVCNCSDSDTDRSEYGSKSQTKRIPADLSERSEKKKRKRSIKSASFFVYNLCEKKL